MRRPETLTLTVRMPKELVEEIARLGSKTDFVIEAVQERLDRIRQEAIEDSLKTLAFDAEANDIEDFATAQSEVMSRVD